jgi:hypothetical protein
LSLFTLGSGDTLMTGFEVQRRRAQHRKRRILRLEVELGWKLGTDLLLIQPDKETALGRDAR